MSSLYSSSIPEMVEASLSTGVLLLLAIGNAYLLSHIEFQIICPWYVITTVYRIGFPFVLAKSLTLILCHEYSEFEFWLEPRIAS